MRNSILRLITSLVLALGIASCHTYNITIAPHSSGEFQISIPQNGNPKNGDIVKVSASSKDTLEHTGTALPSDNHKNYFYFVNTGSENAEIWARYADNEFYYGKNYESATYPIISPIYYRYENQDSWTKLRKEITLYPYQKVYLKRDDPSHKMSLTLRSTGYTTLEIGGNIMSLAYGDDFEGKTTIEARDYFTVLFQGLYNLVDASKLLLPATTLSKSCYFGMFYNCRSLRHAPELPSTTLADSCYARMFEDCSSLQSTPLLKATTLANSCYFAMFYKCKSLTVAPELPALNLADSCYSSMLRMCKSLTKAPILPATKLKRYCYSTMFLGCTGLTKGPELSAKTLAPHCYEGIFKECPNINDITVNFSEWGDTNTWLLESSPTGTIHCPKALDTNKRDTDHIPEGWKVERR